METRTELPPDALLSPDFAVVATRCDLLNTLNLGYRTHLKWSALGLGSVNEFDGVRAFLARSARAGFVHVEVLPMDGWQRGVAHTFVAEVLA